MIILLDTKLKSQSFAVYEVEYSLDYTHTEDMIPTNCSSIFITICDNPKEWAQKNLGMSEILLATVSKEGKVTRTFAAQVRQITLKPRREK